MLAVVLKYKRSTEKKLITFGYVPLPHLITKHKFRIPNARVMRRGSITANEQGFMQVGY
jgi:hypothetical protein